MIGNLVFMLELITQFGLQLCSVEVYLPIIILGFLYLDEKKYGWALFLVLFTMIYNYYLKFLWQMPLPPPMEGWGFPSGHMHAAVVFWGWLACAYHKKWFSMLVVGILALVGYSIVHHGYHYPIDILAAIAFGTVTLIVANYLQTRAWFKENPHHLGIILSLVGVMLLWLLPPESLKPHLWQAIGGLIGFSAGWILLQTQKISHFSLVQKGILLLFTLFTAGFSYFVMSKLPFASSVLIFAEYVAIAWWISSSKFFVQKLDIGMR